MSEKHINCWEFMNCGREMAGAKAAELGVCPAYPHHGKICAHVTGTLCGSKAVCDHASKILNCKDCEYFKSANYDREMAKYLDSH